MKLGFTLKKPKKPSLATNSGNGSGSSAFAAAAPAAASSQAREFVTSFDPNAVALDASGVAKRTLVIPLLRANAWAGRASTDNEAETVAASSESTADEAAARALLEDAVRGTTDANPSANATLVIPMSSLPPPSQQPLRRDTGGAPKADEKDEKRQVRARLFAEKPQAPTTTKIAQVPILRQNAVPGLDALADANDKYRLDVSLRPDALDVHSDAYALVPVEDFGAALLRGMGWKGSDDVATGTTNTNSTSGTIAAPKPRHKLLGLGATARPPMPGDATKKRHGKLRVGTSSGQAEESSRRRSDESSSPPPQPLRQSGLNHTESSRARERDDARNRDRRQSPSRDARRDERRSSQKHGSQSSASRHDSRRSRSRSRDHHHRSDERRKRSRSRESRHDDDRKRTSRR